MLTSAVNGYRGRMAPTPDRPSPGGAGPASPPAARGRTGRRPGGTRTREDIALAAARQFGELGYDRTTLRSVAQEAGVDAALVARFYGSKPQLFASVMRLPFEPSLVVDQVMSGPQDEIGRRLAQFFVALLDSPAADRVLGMIRSAASEAEAARMTRDVIARDILGPLAARLGTDRPEVRGALAGSQLVGIVMARHVVGIEALAELPGDELAALIAPTLQRYLAGPLP